MVKSARRAVMIEVMDDEDNFGCVNLDFRSAKTGVDMKI